MTLVGRLARFYALLLAAAAYVALLAGEAARVPLEVRFQVVEAAAEVGHIRPDPG